MQRCRDMGAASAWPPCHTASNQLPHTRTYKATMDAFESSHWLEKIGLFDGRFDWSSRRIGLTHTMFLAIIPLLARLCY